MILETEELVALQKTCIGRQGQLDLLNVYLSSDAFQTPNALLVHGPPSSGKSFAVDSLLVASGLRVARVRCDQCTTTRILLQRTVRELESSIQRAEGADVSELQPFGFAVENLSAFFSTVSLLFDKHACRQIPHVLVLDRIDQLPEDPSDLYSCFARLSELSDIANITVIFIINTLEPRALLLTSIPHIHFPQFNRAEVAEILEAETRYVEELREHLTVAEVLGGTKDLDVVSQNCGRLWSRFCAVVVDGLGAYTGCNLGLIKDLIRRVWPVFVDPVIQGRIPVEDFGRLYRDREYLFTSEVAVTDSLVEPTLDQMRSLVDSKRSGANNGSYELPRQSKYILCACYLASYNPPRFDVRFFSKAKEARTKRRDTGRRKKLKINPRSLAAPLFDLERMMAILHSLYPDDNDFISNIDIGVQIATLATLRLVLRTSTADPIDSRTRWKVNASWKLVKQLADDISLPIEEYLIE